MNISKQKIVVPQVSYIRYPEYFTDKDKKYARELINLLEESEIITDFDVQILLQYVFIKGQLDRLNEELQRIKLIDFSKFNTTYKSLNDIALKLQKELFLTPQARKNAEKQNYKKQEEQIDEEIDEETVCLMSEFYSKHPDADYEDFKKWRAKNNA